MSSTALNKLAGIFGFNASDNEDDDEDIDDEQEERNTSYDRRSSYNSYDSYDSFDDTSDSYQESREPYRPGRDRDAGKIRGLRDYEGSRSDRPRYGSSSYVSSPRVTTRNMQHNNKVVNLNASVQMEVYVSSPESIEAAREIAEQIKEKKPVIINLERVEYSVAQRITDFLCGVCCAMNGNVQRIADKIFMIAPNNIDFAGDMALQETLNQGDLGFLYGEKE